MNRNIKDFYRYFFLPIIITLLIGCSAPIERIDYTPDREPTPTTSLIQVINSPTPFQPLAPTDTLPPPPTATPLPTKTRSPTRTPAPTITQSPTPSATWVFNDTGVVIAPILLYHHIEDISPVNRYYVSPTKFREQMQALKEWGYSTISPSFLSQIIINGGELPARPVIISFDDGDIDVFENAYPIMQEYGFTGAFYIVSSRLGANGYVGVDQLKELVQAGWEIGSHSTNHYDLTQNHGLVRGEMLQSRIDIQDALSVTVSSFAYPYGLVDEYIANQAQEYGYTTGMGLGIFTEHNWGSIYYLNRREVHGDMDLSAFAGLLPWSAPALDPSPFATKMTSTPPTPTR